MRLIQHAAGRRSVCSVSILVGLTLVLTLFARGAVAQTQPTDAKPAEVTSNSDTYQTIHLNNVTQQNDGNDILTALRNMLSPKSKVYYTASLGTLALRASADDIALAKEIVSELDRPKKSYHLTYTITETDGGKHVGEQRYSLVVVAGGKATLKQGNRVPIVTGNTKDGASVPSSQVQYVDLGLNIDASLEGFADGLRLRSKVEQSSLSDDKSGVGMQDPVIHQTMVDGTSVLVQGKPFVLGSADVPGTTRHQEIEVVSELVK
jgi:type II secretory pathway component GspD/PulD (secretin)